MFYIISEQCTTNFDNFSPNRFQMTFIKTIQCQILKTIEFTNCLQETTYLTLFIVNNIFILCNLKKAEF